jgi:hypothetical protein
MLYRSNKRKPWKDGFVMQNGFDLKLFDEQNCLLERKFCRRQMAPGDECHFDANICSIQDLIVSPDNISSISSQPPAPLKNIKQNQTSFKSPILDKQNITHTAAIPISKEKSKDNVILALAKPKLNMKTSLKNNTNIPIQIGSELKVNSSVENVLHVTNFLILSSSKPKDNTPKQEMHMKFPALITYDPIPFQTPISSPSTHNIPEVKKISFTPSNSKREQENSNIPVKRFKPYLKSNFKPLSAVTENNETAKVNHIINIDYFAETTDRTDEELLLLFSEYKDEKLSVEKDVIVERVVNTTPLKILEPPELSNFISTPKENKPESEHMDNMMHSSKGDKDVIVVRVVNTVPAPLKIPEPQETKEDEAECEHTDNVMLNLRNKYMFRKVKPTSVVNVMAVEAGNGLIEHKTPNESSSEIIKDGLSEIAHHKPTCVVNVTSDEAGNELIDHEQSNERSEMTKHVLLKIDHQNSGMGDFADNELAETDYILNILSPLKEEMPLRFGDYADKMSIDNENGDNIILKSRKKYTFHKVKPTCVVNNNLDEAGNELLEHNRLNESSSEMIKDRLSEIAHQPTCGVNVTSDETGNEPIEHEQSNERSEMTKHVLLKIDHQKSGMGDFADNELAETDAILNILLPLKEEMPHTLGDYADKMSVDNENGLNFLLELEENISNDAIEDYSGNKLMDPPELPLGFHEDQSAYRSLPKSQLKCKFYDQSCGLYFPNTNERKQLVQAHLNREVVIPTYFDSLSNYCAVFEAAILEHVHLQILETAIQFQKRSTFSSSNPQAYFRKYGIDIYFDSQMKLSNGGSTFYLSLGQSRRKSSCYSKDDLWVVSESPDFDECRLFKSVFYGMSASYSDVELSELQYQRGSSIFISDMNEWPKRMFAIRLLNMNTDIIMLEHNSSLKSESLINQILNQDLAKPPDFEIPILKPEKLKDAFHIVELGIKEFQLNEDQSDVIKNVAGILAGSQKEKIALVHGVFGCGKSTLVLFSNNRLVF